MEDKWEAEEVVVGDAGVTRPITNVSPWVSAYDSIRYEDFDIATEAVVTEDCHGGRKMHETYDVSLRLALEIEEARLDGHGLVGLTVDKE